MTVHPFFNVALFRSLFFLFLFRLEIMVFGFYEISFMQLHSHNCRWLGSYLNDLICQQFCVITAAYSSTATESSMTLRLFLNYLMGSLFLATNICQITSELLEWKEFLNLTMLQSRVQLITLLQIVVMSLSFSQFIQWHHCFRL